TLTAEASPTWEKAEVHACHAFAGRALVLIVNTKLLPLQARPSDLLGLLQDRYKGRVVMAKPTFGTTATQAACLFTVLGESKAKAYYSALKDNGVQLAPGNKQVAEWVGRGVTPTGKPAAVGLTDTDDAIDEVKAGRKVAIVFPDSDESGMGTLFIPNTLMLIKDAPNADGGRRLIDFLLSAEIERKLAEGPSAQIPLNPEVTATLPA